LTRGSPFRDFEYIRVLADGIAHYFSASGVPVFDKNQQFTGYRGTTRDITVSRRTEEKERKAAQFLDDIVENIPMAVHLKSVQDGFRVVAWNKAAETSTESGAKKPWAAPSMTFGRKPTPTACMPLTWS
jgi:PAS domain-containing protein